MTKTRETALIFMAPIALLAACAEPVDDSETDALAPVSPTATETESPLAGESTSLVPGVLEASMRREANLTSDLGCVFRRGDDVLLAAAANSVSAESAEGLVVLDGSPVELEMDGEGGYNTLSRGASFSGPDGLSVEVEVRSPAPVRETPAPVVAEPNFTGSLNLRRGAQSVTVEGIYNCGPDSIGEAAQS
ncbi:hypothetical protein P8Q88_06240 [Qipengyuania sp. XHP0207]|uniref:hypothetical protein n=1 Tax=Qipengyuania sp. XHP0207 TaxID=3038078 RepID=UPI00241CEF78|nr:hypothetical protein [Qipengyuania sp. XHP0207]MDG5747775.1 hypothetical protein [Qipengyuania sp. XHP0207]